MKHDTLIKLSVAAVISATVGCSGGGVRWARAHAVADAANAVHYSVGRALAALDPPPAPSARPGRVAVSRAGATHMADTHVAVTATPTLRHPDLQAKLGVKRLVVAHGVKSREPVAPAAAFSTQDKRIYAFVEVSNPERAESAVFVSFVREGERERGRVRLRVGESPRWRTWAYTRLADKPGRYTAMVRDGRGKLLAKAPFEVMGSAPAASPPAAPTAVEPWSAPAAHPQAAVAAKTPPQI